MIVPRRLRIASEPPRRVLPRLLSVGAGPEALPAVRSLRHLSLPLGFTQAGESRLFRLDPMRADSRECCWATTFVPEPVDTDPMQPFQPHS